MKLRACVALWLAAWLSDVAASKLRLHDEGLHRLQKFLPLATLGKAEDNESLNLKHLQDAIAQMAAKRSSQTVDQSDLVIEDMQELFKQYEAKLQGQKTSSQQHLDALPALFHACEALKEQVQGSTGGSLLEVDSIGKFSESHKECRKKEAVAYGEKETSCGFVQALDSVKTTRCDIFQAADKIPQSTVCAAEQQDYKAEVWYDRVITQLTNARAALLDSKKQCDDATSEHAVQIEICTNASQNHSTIQSNCNLAQQSLDQAACAQHESGLRRCDSYYQCHDREALAYQDTIATVQTQEASMKQTYLQLQIVGCMLKTFDLSEADQKTEKEKCRSATYSTDDLVINYPPIPAKTSCAPPQNFLKPSTPEYEAHEYTGLPANAPAKACTATCCPAPSKAQAAAAALRLKHASLVTFKTQQAGAFQAVHQCFSFRHAMNPLDRRSGTASNTSSAHECQKKCSLSHGCSFFTYYFDGSCYLSDGKSSGRAQPGAVSGPADCKGVPSNCYGFNQKYVPSIDKARVTVASAEDCQKLCFHQPGCLYWTMWWDMSCQLAAAGAEPHAQAGTVTGPRLCDQATH
mmetsp:Transcript_34790/g.63337  ORF Transcript_34790/g.63337 Transcript_34790/m.63337 type:complete len:577 (-) Transcript_34790:98-1828(-)